MIGLSRETGLVGFIELPADGSNPAAQQPFGDEAEHHFCPTAVVVILRRMAKVTPTPIMTAGTYLISR